MLNCVPKTAGIYMWDAVAKGLNLRQMRISGSYFPGGVLMPTLIEEFAKGENCLHDHLEASWRNKPYISAYLDKMILHVRDPRMATLEWVLFFSQLEPKLNKDFASSKSDKEKAVNAYENVDAPGFEYWLNVMPEDPRYQPKGFWNMKLEEKIDVHINTFLKDVIEFIIGWLDAEKDPLFKTKILFTRYEDMVEDENKFWDTILDFYSIDKSLFTFKPFKPKPHVNPLVEGDIHYRNSRVDEWRELFSKKQCQIATDMIPERLFKRFKWPVK